MDSKDRLKNLYERVYSHPTLVSAIKALSFGSLWFVVASFTTISLSLLLDGKYIECLGLLSVAAIPFVVVSMARMFLNCERPYETIDLEAFRWMREERKPGRSFPSRHAFSAFLIGVLILRYSIYLGVVTLLVGILLGACRILLGIHYPKDVIAGGLIGIISGIVGLLVL